MARKGFTALSEVRGLMSVPAGADAAAWERSGYVSLMQEANAGRGPW